MSSDRFDRTDAETQPDSDVTSGASPGALDVSADETEYDAPDRCHTDAGPGEVGLVEGGADARYEEAAPRRRGGLTEDGRLRTGRLAGMSMVAAVWVLSWPILIESFLNSLVGLVDTTLAAGIGEAETDAIGGASYMMWFIGLIFMAIGVGATAMIARAMGAGRKAAAEAAMGQSTTVGLIVGLVTAGVIGAIARPLAMLLNLSPLASMAFESYLAVIALGAPFSFMLFVLIACARGAGDPRRPLYAMIVRNVVNIIVSFALAGATITLPNPFAEGGIVLQSPYNLGVVGIAAGTVCGDLAGMFIVLGMARSGVWGIRLRKRRMHPHRITIARLYRLALPNFLETLGMWAGNFLIIVIVGLLALEAAHAHGASGGSGLLGAHIVAIRIEAFSFLPGFAVGMAAATLAGQYLGAGAPKHAHKAVLLCTALATSIMTAMGFAFIFIPKQIVGLFTQQPTHLEQTPHLLFYCGMVQIPFAIAIVFRQAMRGAGDVRAVMWITWLTTYGLRLPLAYFFSGVDIPLPAWLGGGVFENPSPFDLGLRGLWIGLCIELGLRGVAFSARFIQGGWMRAKV